MSRLFATFLMNTNNIEPDELARVFSGEFNSGELNITGKYLSNKKQFEFKVLDFYSYMQDRSVFFYNVKIDEVDLLRMLRIDNYSDDEKNELYYHKLLTQYEQVDLDDDVYWGISILQYFFHISTRTLADMKKQAHLFKLHRVPTKNVYLKLWKLHSNGGRKLGSVSGIEWQNIENADRIINTCVEKDRFQEFMDLHRELIRAHKTDLSITGAKWKFYILRYKWKLSNDFLTRNPDYEKQLIDKNNQYNIFEKLDF